MVLECGGNGRSFFSPPASGNQWTNGGAGCAEWTGVRARRRAEGGGRQAVRHLQRHYGSDLHLSGDASKPTLSRGVPYREGDGSENNLIVWAMNGQPLPNIHGFPVRLVIAGWPGSASQKWFDAHLSSATRSTMVPA